MAAQMRASTKRHRVESSSGVAPPPPSSTGDPAEVYVDPTAAATPPPSTSDDLDIRCMLNTVMTIQVAYGKLLVDVLIELQSLRADLASLKRSPPSPPFDDERLPFGNFSQKGVHLDR